MHDAGTNRRYEIEPKVDAVREFLEIAGDFTNPLERVREAISNAIDAGAENIGISFTRPKERGHSVLLIVIEDDGCGMDEADLQSFFDLGNSSKRGDPASIGEKGHGTKVYFNCASIRVDTTKDGVTLRAHMEAPFASLHDGTLPSADVERVERPGVANGTRIEIRGFNGNQAEVFSHDRLKDYALWFSKFGSWEREIGVETHAAKILRLKGLDRDEPEEIAFGHVFPEESLSISKLFDEYVVKAPDHYCRKVVRHGALRRHPEIKFAALFYIEGNKVKQSYNRMLKRQGVTPPPGAYKVQDRYGVWLCKDFIPVQRQNDWISTKGSEYTKFHAFVNCQELSLTANRGSVANTNPAVLEDLQESVEQIYADIVQGDEWREIEWLEEQSTAYLTDAREKKDFEWRIKRARSANVATLDGVRLVEPRRESGVYGLLVQIMTLRPDLFPFQIVDYDTHSGIDVIAKHRNPLSAVQSDLYYVELKYFLGGSMNHTFGNMRYVVCWDTQVKDGGKLVDLSGNEREMYIVPPGSSPDANYTGYYLRVDRKSDIEVFVLKDFLREKLGIEFRPQTTQASAA